MGGVGGNIDIEYVLYTLSTEFNTLYNTAEKPVKSAVLKGQTLVNSILNQSKHSCVIKGNSSNGGNYSLEQSDVLFSKNTNYTFFYTVENCTTNNNIVIFTSSAVSVASAVSLDKTLGRHCVSFTTKNEELTHNYSFYIHSAGDDSTIDETNQIVLKDLVIVKGDYTNQIIPYFEGMQSVKLPVLTTVGKNLFNSTFEKNTLDWETGVESIDINVVRTVSYTRVKPNESYVITKQNISGALFYYDKNKSHIKTEWVNPVETINFTTTSDTHFIKMILNTTKTEHNIQLEQGTQATPYEPYKTNILTCNEDVELHGVGEVKDELDLVTGEVTRRIGKMVLDGSEKSIYIDTTKEVTVVFEIKIPDSLFSVGTGEHLISDKLLNRAPGDVEKFVINIYDSRTMIYVALNKTKASTIPEFREYLSKNPITLLGAAKDQAIETAILSTKDQDEKNTKLKTFDDITYVTLSSEGLIPEAELEVATKNEEVLATMSLRMDDIYAAQTTLEETSNTQSENVDATMFATTEIYEELL